MAPIGAVCGIRLHVGVSGSGKTYGMKTDVFNTARFMPVLAIDRMAEWGTVPRALVHKGFVTIGEACDWLREGEKRRRNGLAIVRDTGDVAQAFDLACRWAVMGDGPRGVACSEIHRACPNHVPLLSNVEAVATQWRHKQVALFIDTPRLSLLSPTLREQSTSGLKIFSVFGPRDLAVIAETWGAQVEAAVRECSRRFVAGGGVGGNGAGWYVRPNVPPYKLERDR